MATKKELTQKQRDAINEYSNTLADAIANKDECACIPVKTAEIIEKLLPPILF